MYSILFEIEFHNEMLNFCKVAVFMKLECFFIKLSYILAFGHFLQVFFKLDEFIILSTVVRKYGNSIFELKNIWIWGIVN